MNIFDYYTDTTRLDELESLLNYGAQEHPKGLAVNFLEKDIWVTEVLRLLYEEELLGTDKSVAFKGGTALSKGWGAIERFSEDIDLSVHWADLAESSDEADAWERSTRNRSQQNKFRRDQAKLLEEWTEDLVTRLNDRFRSYDIAGLEAVLDPDSKGEKVEVHFPAVTANKSNYQLDHVLLEFGGRNRGRPTECRPISCYLSEVSGLADLALPKAAVRIYDPAYILLLPTSPLSSYRITPMLAISDK